MASNPSFVFSYLPPAAKASTSNSTTSLTDQSSSFFHSARKAFVTPKLTAEQDRVQILKQTKQHLEAHAALKAKAGMSISDSEKAQLKRVEKVLAGLSQ